MADKNPSWNHFSDTSASATAPLAYARQASDQLPAACEAGVDNLEEEYELQIPNLDDELNTYFTCIDNIANIELYTPDSDLLIAAGTIDNSDPYEKVVDLSDYIDGNSLEISEEEKELIGYLISRQTSALLMTKRLRLYPRTTAVLFRSQGGIRTRCEPITGYTGARGPRGEDRVGQDLHESSCALPLVST
jgi:hypothetical protein